MMSVNAQNGMAVETLSPMQDTNLYQSTKSVEDDAMSEESFRLQMSEDEDEDVSGKKKETVTNGIVSPVKPSTPTETEDDILNKFDSTDSGSILEHVDDNLENKLLDENEVVGKDGKVDDKESTLEKNKDVSENNSVNSLSNNEIEVCVNDNDVNSKEDDNTTTNVNNSEDINVDIEKSVPIVEDNVQNVENANSQDETSEKTDEVINEDDDKPKADELNKIDDESTPMATESTAETTESKAETTESKAETSESKVETIEDKAETIESKAESIESKNDATESKAETSESKVETIKGKAETTESKAESIESKNDTTESKAETIESKNETTESKAETIESKGETKESTSKIDEEASKMEEDLPKLEESISKTNETVSKMDEDAKVEESNEEKQQKEQKEKDDILKDQIMDTEDLLQIVEKNQTEETDKEDSSGRNSPGSPEDVETDKMDVECDDMEAEKMDCDDEEDEEESRILKQVSKDDDGVDIDESSPYKDCDADMDKEYDNLVASADLDESSQETTTKKPETTEKKETDNKISKINANNELEIRTVEQKDNSEMESAVTKDKAQSDKSAEKETVENENVECSVVTLTGEHGKDGNSTKPAKRSLTDSDVESHAKKLKLNESEKTVDETVPPVNIEKEKESDMVILEKEATPTPIEIHTLNAIEEYIRLKALKKLTYKDLEQIVLQKICEAICHKSEIGELRHQLGVQEQMVEMWRKEVVQLTKQARDLEIVNKRLLHEVRARNEKEKAPMPVKITRSVGLQVRSDNSVVNNVMASKRKVNNRPQVTPPSVSPVKQNRVNTVRTNVNNRVNTVTKIVNSNNNNNNNKVTTPINKTTTATTKVGTTTKIIPVNSSNNVSSSAKLKTIAPKANATSQNSTTNSTSNSSSTSTSPSTTTTSNVTTTPAATSTSTSSSVSTTTTSASNKSSNANTKLSAKSVTAEPKAVIDLTDEDDKKPVTTVAASNQNQAVRIVSTPVKTTNVTTANSPRIMYVYNNQLHQGVLSADASKTGSPKLMLKLNSGVLGSTNGVIAAVSNGSAIAVTSSPVRTNQVQPVRLATPVTSVRTTVAANNKSVLKHPAPLPAPPANQVSLPSRKPVPPKPHLSIKRSNNGLILSWKMPYNLENYEAIASYQLYAYQETTSPPSSEMWRKVGDVKALALPMACTLTQFADGNKYHFAVRAVDVLKRMGSFSDPEQILL